MGAETYLVTGGRRCRALGFPLDLVPAGVMIESVAESVLFLLSDRSASITGQALVVDAGSSA